MLLVTATIVTVVVAMQIVVVTIQIVVVTIQIVTTTLWFAEAISTKRLVEATKSFSPCTMQPWRNTVFLQDATYLSHIRGCTYSILSYLSRFIIGVLISTSNVHLKCIR